MIVKKITVRREQNRNKTIVGKYNCDNSSGGVGPVVHWRMNREAEEKIISTQTAVDSFRSLRTEFVSTRFRETRFSCRRPGKNRTELVLSLSLFHARAGATAISERRNYFRSQLADNELLNSKDGNCCSPFAKTSVAMLRRYKRNGGKYKTLSSSS